MNCQACHLDPSKILLRERGFVLHAVAQPMPRILRLPTAIVRLVIRAQLKVDPAARSSMWQDLDARRLTEVDYLNGEIVKVAEASGAKAPLNQRIVELIREAEAAKAGSPRLSADERWRRLN